MILKEHYKTIFSYLERADITKLEVLDKDCHKIIAEHMSAGNDKKSQE